MVDLALTLHPPSPCARYLTKVEVEMPEDGGRAKCTWEKIEIVSALPEDPEVAEVRRGGGGWRGCEVYAVDVCVWGGGG